MLLLVFFWLLSPCPAKASDSPIDPVEQINQISELIEPTIRNATDWGEKFSLKVLGTFAFYALVLRATKVN